MKTSNSGCVFSQVEVQNCMCDMFIDYVVYVWLNCWIVKSRNCSCCWLHPLYIHMHFFVCIICALLLIFTACFMFLWRTWLIMKLETFLTNFLLFYVCVFFFFLRFFRLLILQWHRINSFYLFHKLFIYLFLHGLFAITDCLQVA